MQPLVYARRYLGPYAKRLHGFMGDHRAACTRRGLENRGFIERRARSQVDQLNTTALCRQALCYCKTLVDRSAVADQRHITALVPDVRLAQGNWNPSHGRGSL